MRKLFMPLWLVMLFLIAYSAASLFATDVAASSPKAEHVLFADPSAKPSTSVPTGDVPAGHHKLLYRVARDRAIAQYAKDKGITRAAAREKAEQIDDSTVHAAVKAAGLQFKDLPVGSKLEDILTWIVDHQELIISLVKIFLTLLELL